MSTGKKTHVDENGVHWDMNDWDFQTVEPSACKHRDPSGSCERCGVRRTDHRHRQRSPEK